jgi:hypothetical protein
MNPTHSIPVRQCPQCGRLKNRQTNVVQDPSLPVVGDIDLCAYCGCLTVIDVDGKMRVPSPEKLAELKADKEVWSAIQLATEKIANGTWRELL